MRLDQSFISIRERATLETLDLAWHVISRHFWSLIGFLALGALPFAVINFYVSRSFTYDFRQNGLFNMFLVYSQVQIGTLFVTSYLGQATFVGRPDWRVVVRSVLGRAGGLAYLHGILRLIFPAWMLLIGAALVSEIEASGAFIGFAIAILIVSMLVRCGRPFATEILVLEMTPFRTTPTSSITYAKRSRSMHQGAFGDGLNLQWMGAIFSIPLLFAIYGGLSFSAEMCGFPFEIEWMHSGVLWQMALWLVAGFWTVVRFLFYMDSRIRQEGWEVELKVRAAAMQLAEASGR